MKKQKFAGQISLLDELIVDSFAGGGGASTGIELATGRVVDIAYIYKGNYCANCAARLDGRDSYVYGTYFDWDKGNYCPTFGEDKLEVT